MIQLALIEDDEVVRNHLAAFFFRQEGVNCGVIAASVEDFFEKTEKVERLDIVLTDIGYPVNPAWKPYPRSKRDSRMFPS